MVASRSAGGTSPLTAMAIIGGMFFIFGFVTFLNGPLITFVKLAFRVNDALAFLVPFAFYISYFVFSLPAAAILKRTGMKRGMALGLAVMALGAACFGQFATMRIFPGAITGLFVIGAGLSILQTASNPYVSIMGPIGSAAQRIAFMGICNKGAGILAPLLFSVLVMQGIGQFADRIAAAHDPAAKEALLNSFAAKIHDPYMMMAGLLALLAVLVVLSPLPDIGDEANETPAHDDAARSLFSYPQLWFGFVCLFFYVGVEVMAADAIGTYGNGFGLPLDQTKFFTAFTMAGMLAGYVAGLLLIPRFVAQETYLSFFRRPGDCAVAGRVPDKRISIGGSGGGVGLRQCHDVSRHLSLGDPGPGTAHRNRFGHHGDGHCRRRGAAAAVRPFEGRGGVSDHVRLSDGAGLCLYSVFRPVRRAAKIPAGLNFRPADSRYRNAGYISACCAAAGRHGEKPRAAET